MSSLCSSANGRISAYDRLLRGRVGAESILNGLHQGLLSSVFSHDHAGSNAHIGRTIGP